MDSELEALIQTYAYAKCQKVYEYCEGEYMLLMDEIASLKKENSSLKKKLKSSTSPYNEEDYNRMRELCLRMKRERDYYKKMYKIK